MRATGKESREGVAAPGVGYEPLIREEMKKVKIRFVVDV